MKKGREGSWDERSRELKELEVGLVSFDVRITLPLSNHFILLQTFPLIQMLFHYTTSTYNLWKVISITHQIPQVATACRRPCGIDI